MTATGMFTQKMARHVHSVRKPPSSGPMAVRPPAIPKNSASARPRSRRANVCTTMARAAGNMMAPPAPWRIRKATIQASAKPPFGVRPHRAEAAGEHEDPHGDHGAVADGVGQPAAEGEEGGQRHQVGVDGPLDTGARQPEMSLDLGSGDGHDGLVDERHRDGEDHRRQDQVPRPATGGAGDGHVFDSSQRSPGPAPATTGGDGVGEGVDAGQPARQSVAQVGSERRGRPEPYS